MLEVLSTFGIDVSFVFSGLILSAVILLILYKRFFFSVFEPLSAFVVAQIGDATVMWALPLSVLYKWQFVGYMLSLWLGFAIKVKKPVPMSRMVLDRALLSDLRFTLVIMCVLIVGANLYLGATVGFPLLSADPTNAKFTVYAGGLGVVRRLNMGPYFLFCCGCVLLIVFDESRRLALLILGAATSLVILDGGKSVVLPLLFASSFAVTHYGVNPSDDVRQKANKYLAIMLTAGISIALVVTTKEQGSFLGGIQAFALRLLLAGDGIAFYFPRREIVKDLVKPGVMGYFYSTFADTLGVLRIRDYQDSLGGIIKGSEAGGPNAQYFLLADIFFKPAIGCVYSFFVGYVLASLRNGFFHTKTRSIGVLAAQLFLALVAFDLAMDASLFITEVSFAFLLSLPLYCFAKVCRFALADPLPKSRNV